ncbi:MAG: hypothetical protein M1831_001365, partial [Alyxoria varia]
MVRSLELEFDMKSRDEQRRLRGEVSRLRQLGQKISYFVDRFGLGILLLLPVSNDALGQRHCLSIPLG